MSVTTAAGLTPKNYEASADIFISALRRPDVSREEGPDIATLIRRVEV